GRGGNNGRGGRCEPYGRGMGVMGGMRMMERLPQSQRVGAAGYVNTN
ncbi:hypothetical protein HMPREF9073_00065, partial [Capnocytophaga sp. oral taxon 326 str. F0382]